MSWFWRGKHHRDKGKYILLLNLYQSSKCFYILVIVIVTITADKTSKKNIAENSTEVSLKTPTDFQSPSNRQELQSPTEFDGNKTSACFSNIIEKFTIKLTNIMGNFSEVLTNNQAKHINKISDETDRN